jgi:ribosome-associated protein
LIVVNEQLAIPESELTFTASRSGGPGGQNVNKVSSRVTLTFNVRESRSLSDDQRSRVSEKLRARINKDGVLRIISQRTRSQDLNREDAGQRFAELLRDALTIEKSRIKTRAPSAAREQRLQEKKKRTVVKQFRTRRVPED